MQPPGPRRAGQMRKHVKTETYRRMFTRFTWLLGVLVLLTIGFLVACSGSKYSSSSDGLLIVPSQGSLVLQAFSFNLSNGRPSQVNTAPTIDGTPTAIVLDPGGAFAYVAYSAPDAANNGTYIGAVNAVVAAYAINSNGTLSAAGTPITLQGLSRTGLPNPPTVDPVLGNPPVALTIDTSGKFLFVSDQATAVSYTDSNDQPATATLSGTVSVVAIGAGASLSEVPNSPFSLPDALGGTDPNPTAVAVTPTLFPATNAACSSLPAPTTEYLYVTDAANDRVLGFLVDSASGELEPPTSTVFSIATGKVPSGVAVDPCNRFVYVANKTSNNVSAYTICTGISANCSGADGSLVPTTDSPVPAGNSPGPMVIDPFANFLYVVDGGQNQISAYKISQITGTLSALSSATAATGTKPVSIAARSDGNWLFVANNGSASVSQYAITPATGALTPQPTITTDNDPWGVAVK